MAKVCESHVANSKLKNNKAFGPSKLCMLASRCMTLLRPSRLAHLPRTMRSTLAATGQENLPAAKLQRTEPPAHQLREALRVHLLNEHAVLPKRGSAGAAGFDLAR